MESAATTAASPPAEPPRDTLCPACGYDLRGTAGGRCSECGLEIDPAALARSGVPWAYRREIGRLRAFLKTVWQVTFDAKDLRHEAAKPQSARDAATFRRWVTALVFVCLAGLVAMMVAMDGVEEVVVQKRIPFGGVGAGRLSGWEQDLLVPWSAGIALPGALFGYALLAAVVLTGASGAVLRTAGMAPERAEATRAIGSYAAAPLAWLVPATIAFVAQAAVSTRQELSEFNGVTVIATALWILAAALAIVGTVYRTGQWRARVTHAGYATGFLGMGELLLRWAVGLGVVAFAVPWCVGLLWIVVDSFRG